MAAVTGSRLKRLAKDRRLLHDNFPDAVMWIDPTGKPKVEVEMVSRSNRSYTLRLYIADDYPNSCPQLTLVTPLADQDGEPLPERSSEFVTRELHEGLQSICHYNQSEWFGGKWLFQVFVKGQLWLEAYECYLETGEHLRHILRRYYQSSDPSSQDFVWAPRQTERLLYEKKLLAMCHPGRVIKWSDNQRTIDVEIETKNANVYRLGVYLPADYPNKVPTLVVVSPRELQDKNGDAIPECSAEFRTLKKRDGNTTLCHYSQGDWMGNLTIDKVFTEGELWVNAYDDYILAERRTDFTEFLNRQIQCSADL